MIGLVYEDFKKAVSSKEKPFDKKVWSKMLFMSKKQKIDYIKDFSQKIYNYVNIENDDNINKVLYEILYFEENE